MQKIDFLRKNGFESSFFYKIDVLVVTNWSVRLEKHQTIEILLMVDFLRNFKMLHFSNFFEIFEIHQYFLVILLNASLFEHCWPNTVELDMSIFAIKVLRLLQCEHYIFFFQFSKRDSDVW